MQEDKVLKLLGLATKASKITNGMDHTIMLLAKGKIAIVLVAKDIGASSKKKIEQKAREANVPIITLADSALLGKFTAAKLRSVVGITDEHFASGLLNLLKDKD